MPSLEELPQLFGTLGDGRHGILPGERFFEASLNHIGAAVMKIFSLKLPPFRWGSLPAELLILAFLGVFLIYPLAYIGPGSASQPATPVRAPSKPSDALLPVS